MNQLRRASCWCLLVGLFFALLAFYPRTADAANYIVPDTVGARDVVYDATRSLVYISKGTKIYRYDPVSGASLAPVTVGINLMGMDIEADGDHLLVADRVAAGSTGIVRRVDLENWSVENLTYPFASGELGGFAVAAAHDGSFLVSGLFNGSGSVPLRKWNPDTASWSTLRNCPASSYTGAMVKASDDRQVIALAETNSSAGRYGYYKPATGTISLRDMSRYLYEITTNADGSHLVVPSYQGLAILDSDFVAVANPAISTPLNAVYSPDYKTLLVATSSDVRVIDAVTGEFIQSFACDGLSWIGNRAMERGRMAVSSDGARLFITTSNGVTQIQLAPGTSLVLGPPVQRIAGADRYRTAVENSKLAFPAGARTVVIATGANWPDALGGSALGGAVEGPLLLTHSDALPDSVRAEIKRLGATKAYVLGGTGAVSKTVETALTKALSGDATVTRIAGADRYITAGMVAWEVVSLQGSGYDGGALVTTGVNYPDALAGSPLAAAKGWPILLANPSNSTIYLPNGLTHAVILGGTGAVPWILEAGLSEHLGRGNVVRIGGANRYATAARVARYGVNNGMTWNGVGIATGDNFPDALSAGVMLGSRGSVLLLTQANTLSGDAKTTLQTNAEDIDCILIIGGKGAVSDAVKVAAEAASGL